MSFLEFYNKYFEINLNDYPEIGIDLEISRVLLAFLIAIIVATVIINVNRAATITFIKKLVRLEALSEENAKSIKELKLNNVFASIAIKSNGKVKNIIQRVGEKKYTYEEYTEMIKKKEYKEEKIDLSTARFYINPDSSQEAQALAESTSPTVLNTVLFCILSVAVFFCIILILPEILTFINNLLK